MARLPVRDELVGAEPYGAPQIDVPVLLNTNENPYAPPPEVVDDIAARVARAAAGLHRYPDREAQALRAALADYLNRDPAEPGLDASRVWAANGSNEVMQQILQAFGGPGRTALSFAPTYSMYPEYARNTSTTWVTVPRGEAFAVDTEAAAAAIAEHRPSVIFVPSPNNPTGTALPLEAVEAICDAAARIPSVVVVDEAYAEFRRQRVPSALSLLPRYAHLIVTRTLSKAFALAGGRLGYVAAGTEVIDLLRVVRLPYHLSSISQAVAEAALDHAPALLAKVDALRDERDELVAWLRGEGLQVADSDANFVLFGKFSDRHAIWQAVLDRGVLIRETGPDGWLRVSVGTPDDMAAFRAALTHARSEGDQP